MTTAQTAPPDLEALVANTQALSCLQCGKCTGVCPVAIYGETYSPRQVLTKTVRNGDHQVSSRYQLNECLTCSKCDEYCPAGVKYTELMFGLRHAAREPAHNGLCPHAGALMTLQRLMTLEERVPDRLGWVTDEMETAESGEYLYYAGCSPFLDVFFAYLQVDTVSAARSSVLLLNQHGIVPVLMAEERCCGHDLAWSGDIDNFMLLAEKNFAAIEATGAQTILFSCAECLSAFSTLYPKFGLTLSAKLVHMSQFLAEQIASGALELSEDDQITTYHDPCRLGRHLGLYDEPRQVLSAGNNGQFREMRQNRSAALCCGVSAWLHCDADTKALQVARLDQASEIGAQIMAVACPKCQVHLSCANRDRAEGSWQPQIRDISTITWDRLQLSSMHGNQERDEP